MKNAPIDINRIQPVLPADQIRRRRLDIAGVIAPVVTPCTPQGTLDLEGLEAVCADMISAGCSGLFLAGTTGRGPWFDLKTKVKLCRAIAKRFGQDCLMLGGCMANGVPNMLESAAALAEAGANVAVVTAPGYFAYAPEEVERIFLQFADKSPLPVVIYDIPSLAGSALDDRMLTRLARHEKIIGLKDSTADAQRARRLASLVGAGKHFRLIQGKEHLLASSLKAGWSALIVSLVHFDPGLFVALFKAVKCGQLDRATAIQRVIVDLKAISDACFARQPVSSTFFHFLNAVLRQRGLCRNILLAHEGACPAWIDKAASQALTICREARLQFADPAGWETQP